MTKVLLKVGITFYTYCSESGFFEGFLISRVCEFCIINGFYFNLLQLLYPLNEFNKAKIFQ